MEITTVVQRLHSFTLTEGEIREYIDHPTELAAELERVLLPPKPGHNGHKPRARRVARGKAVKSGARKGGPKRRAKAWGTDRVKCPGCGTTMTEANFKSYHKKHCKKLTAGQDALVIAE